MFDLLKDICSTARKLPDPHFTFYIAHTMKKALLAKDQRLDEQIVSSVSEIDYLVAIDGSRQFVVTDFQGKRYRVTVAEERA